MTMSTKAISVPPTLSIQEYLVEARWVVSVGQLSCPPRLYLINSQTADMMLAQKSNITD